MGCFEVFNISLIIPQIFIGYRLQDKRQVLSALLNISVYRAAVFNLWVKTPLGIKQLFHRGYLRLLENTDIYVTIHNTSKITAIK